MLRRAVLTLAVLMCLPGAALAQVNRASDPILDAIRVPELLEIMAEESRAQGEEIDTGMLGGTGGPGWARMVDAIHAPARWEPQVRDTFDAALPPDQVAPILDFVTSEQGQRILDLELSARRALLDDEIDAANRARLEALRADEAPLLDAVRRFVEANDLIDTNVVGALNANAAFLQALQDAAGTRGPGGAAADVWAQEPQIRAQTVDWVYGFLTMAYAPLPGPDLDAYIAFSESPAGQALNAALFEAFGEMFVATSRETGTALGRLIQAEDI